ncbi:MAG: class I SAM-dependent methyltransferase [Gemmatimonadetes bacterium]|nr:class I SAM-dependent methyltransferase [Gemmatimonadota bacterium]
MVVQSASRIRADFDRLAALGQDGWDHNVHYHPFLLRHLPPRCRAALDVGCGSGAFAEQLARRADTVLAIDLSPGMVRLARERLARYPGAEVRLADFSEADLPREHFDCVASIATLHHLPLRSTLARIAGLLRPGGVLLVLDLYRPSTLTDRMCGAVAFPASVGLGVVRRGRLRPPREVREAWNEHARTDVYPTLAEVREASREVLPGARVRRHLFWRYSLIWRKPAGPAPSGT